MYNPGIAALVTKQAGLPAGAVETIATELLRIAIDRGESPHSTIPLDACDPVVRESYLYAALRIVRLFADAALAESLPRAAWCNVCGARGLCSHAPASRCETCGAAVAEGSACGHGGGEAL